MSYEKALQAFQFEDLHRPPSPQLSRDSLFEQNVEDGFGALSQQLTDIRASLRDVPNSIAHSMPSIIRSTMIELMPMMRQMSSQKGMQVDPRQLQAMHDRIQHLTIENGSLVEMKATAEREISSLRNDLVKRNREIRDLHEIIIQTGEPNTDTSDESVVKGFGDLSHEIMRAVSRHYSIPETKMQLPVLDGMTKDDRTLYVRSRVANFLYKSFLSSKAQLFGIDPERDKYQRELENKLRERGVDEADITEWRIATVKVAAKMNLKKSHNAAWQAADDLAEELEKMFVVADTEAAEGDITKLCTSAFDLGLRLRGSRATYEWRQAVKPESLPSADIELVGPWSASDDRAPLRPARVMFGPLYKIVEGEVVLLRHGDVLGSN